MPISTQSEIHDSIHFLAVPRVRSQRRGRDADGRLEREPVLLQELPGPSAFGGREREAEAVEGVLRRDEAVVVQIHMGRIISVIFEDLLFFACVLQLKTVRCSICFVTNCIVLCVSYSICIFRNTLLL